MSLEVVSVEKLIDPNKSPFDSRQWSEHFGCDFCYLWALNVNDYAGALEGSLDNVVSDDFLNTWDGNTWKLEFRTRYNNLGEEIARISLMSLDSEANPRYNVKLFVSANFLDKNGVIYSPAGGYGVQRVDVTYEDEVNDLNVLKLSDFKIPFSIEEHLDSIRYEDSHLRILLRMWDAYDDDNTEFEASAASLTQNLGSLLDDPIFADVTLQVGTTQILAHRAVLAAQSTVFREHLICAPKAPQGIITLDLSAYSLNVVHAMLKYMYTDAHPKVASLADLGLITIAQEYKLDSLKQLYGREFGGALNTRNVVDALECSLRCDCQVLRDQVVNYVKTAKVSLKGNSKFKKLADKYPNDVLAILAAVTETPVVSKPKRAKFT